MEDRMLVSRSQNILTKPFKTARLSYFVQTRLNVGKRVRRASLGHPSISIASPIILFLPHPPIPSSSHNLIPLFPHHLITLPK